MLEIVYGPYPNRTYGFDTPKGMWKVIARLPVGKFLHVMGMEEGGRGNGVGGEGYWRRGSGGGRPE